MEDLLKGGGIIPHILDLESGWSASCPTFFTPSPGERAPGTHWIGGWVGSKASLDAVGKRKIHIPHQKSSLRILIIQPVASRYTD
jgi:hypothetical protein